MQHSVDSRRQEETDVGNKGNTTEEGVGRSKDFSGIVFEISYGTHTTEDHGGIEQRIDPLEFGDVMIAEYANCQTKKHDQGGYDYVIKNTAQKDAGWGKWLWFSFKHSLVTFEVLERLEARGAFIHGFTCCGAEVGD